MKDILVTTLTSGLTTTIVLILYRHLLKRNIETYKNSLLLDLQRKFHDFQLFATKRHEKYAILYSALYTSTDEVLSVTSWYKEFPSFMNYTKSELEDYLNQQKLLQVDKFRILDLWDSDKREMQKELQKIIEHNRAMEADKLRIVAYKQFSESIIYLSDKVVYICEGIIKIQREVMLDYVYYMEDANHTEKKEVRGKINNYQNNLKNLRSDLQKEMQSELSIGYYEDKK